MPCNAIPVFIDDMPRFARSTVTVTNTEYDPETIRVNCPSTTGQIILSNQIFSMMRPTTLEMMLPDPPVITEIDMKIHRQDEGIVISETFLDELDDDVAELAKRAVEKLNQSIHKMKEVTDKSNRAVRFSTMQYIPRPTVIPLDGNKPVSTTIKRPINGCGCLPFSMKQFFAHKTKNV
jgi:hypothetical protein